MDEKVLNTSEIMNKIEDMEMLKNKTPKEKEEFWKEKALYDPLTKLPNRTAADYILNSIKNTCKWLVVIDIDHFKKINDAFGHQVGDLILKKIANYLKNNFITIRFGGEEFVGLIVSENLKKRNEIINYLEKIRQGIENLEFKKIDENLSITVSIGVTRFDKNRTFEDLFEEADKALYCAKDWGRNQVVFYEEGMDCKAHDINEEGIIKNPNKCENNKIKEIMNIINHLSTKEIKNLSEKLEKGEK